jgi:NADPH-dependent ferric siderophore reductase
MTPSPAPASIPGRHELVRMRQEPRRRSLKVVGVQDITPAMRRVSFTSPELKDFSSAGFDDHVKLFFPPPPGESGRGPGGMVMRDYTPRAFDREQGVLVIDFVLHDAGPATAWARAAEPGTDLAVGGPRGSTVTPDDFDWHVFTGDETALPAIGRRLEELRAGAPVVTAIAIASPQERQTLSTAADHSALWAVREAGIDDATALKAVLNDFIPPPGDGYVWIAAEAQVARALRVHAQETFAGQPVWIKASGYWVQGRPGETEKLDAPTQP